MEDYILREIDKIGLVIKVILMKIGVMRHSGVSESLYAIVKNELLDKLDIDLDTLLGFDNFVDVLVGRYGFSNDNLEKFAELLYDFMLAGNDETVKKKYAEDIFRLYRLLESAGYEFSFNTYLIIQELEKYK